MITVYIAAFPGDCWGYFGTYDAATAWVDAFRKHKESLYDLPPKHDGAMIERRDFESLDVFCQEVNDNLRAGWRPPA
jgi:hypothetical protein